MQLTGSDVNFSRDSERSKLYRFVPQVSAPLLNKTFNKGDFGKKVIPYDNIFEQKLYTNENSDLNTYCSIFAILK